MINNYHIHHPAYHRLANIDSGYTYSSANFMQHYQINPHFKITCLACCATYLVANRYYNHEYGTTRVIYGNNPITSCYVEGPRGRNGVHGLVVTNSDPMIGQIMKIRPVQSSHSYQFYNNATTSLSIGTLLIARVEAIAVTQINNREKIGSCYFNHCDASLIELYRESMGKNSLYGTMIVIGPQLPINNLTEDMNKKLSLLENYN